MAGMGGGRLTDCTGEHGARGDRKAPITDVGGVEDRWRFHRVPPVAPRFSSTPPPSVGGCDPMHIHAKAEGLLRPWPTSNSIRTMSRTLVLAVISAIVGVMYGLTDNFLAIVVQVSELSGSGLPDATTLSLLGPAARALTLVWLAALVAVGYAVGTRIAFSKEYPAVFASAAIGIGVGYFLVHLLAIPRPEGTGIAMSVSIAAFLATVAAINLGLVTFAGAALGHLRRSTAEP